MTVKLSEQDDKIYWKLYYSEDVNKDIHRYGIENGMLKAACGGGHLQLVKYLLDTTNTYVATLDYNNNWGFIEACKNGKLHVVKFLIDYKQGERIVNIYDQNDNGFKEAVNNQHIKVAQFLLSYNPLISDKDKQIQNERFIMLCKLNEDDLIKFCIHDLNIEKNKYISEQLTILKTMPKYQAAANNIESLFSMRDLKDNLTNKFSDKEFKKNNKNKV